MLKFNTMMIIGTIYPCNEGCMMLNILIICEICFILIHLRVQR